MAIFEIYDEINMNLVKDFMWKVVEAKRKNQRLVLYICSKGGSTNFINPIWETLKDSKIDCLSIGYGIVASTAAAIFMMPAKRILIPGTKFILHKSAIQYSTPVHLTEDEISEISKNSKNSTEVLWAPIIENSSIRKKVLIQKTHFNDWELTDGELQKYAIATEPHQGWFDIILKESDKN
jgi:ATP-dependent protease ClpP protease subunit